MRHSTPRVLLFACWLVLACVPAARAQVSTFDLSGIVTDDSDAVLPGATVSLRNVKTGLAANGNHRQRRALSFRRLARGGRICRPRRDASFASEERTGLTFTANTAAGPSFRLKLASLAENVTVQAEAPVLNTRSAQLSVTVDQKQIETMPLNGRNYLDLALVHPE